MGLWLAAVIAALIAGASAGDQTGCLQTRDATAGRGEGDLLGEFHIALEVGATGCGADLDGDDDVAAARGPSSRVLCDTDSTVHLVEWIEIGVEPVVHAHKRVEIANEHIRVGRSGRRHSAHVVKIDEGKDKQMAATREFILAIVWSMNAPARWRWTDQLRDSDREADLAGRGMTAWRVIAT